MRTGVSGVSVCLPDWQSDSERSVWSWYCGSIPGRYSLYLFVVPAISGKQNIVLWRGEASIQLDACLTRWCVPVSMFSMEVKGI